jgi:hypothetical protein
MSRRPSKLNNEEMHCQGGVHRQGRAKEPKNQDLRESPKILYMRIFHRRLIINILHSFTGKQHWPIEPNKSTVHPAHTTG